jgi:hypothetical protein
MLMHATPFPPPLVPGAEYYRFRRDAAGQCVLATLSGRPPRDVKRNGATYEDVVKAERAGFSGIAACKSNGDIEYWEYPTDAVSRAVKAKTAQSHSAPQPASRVSAAVQSDGWRKHRVVVCDGSFDTHINDGDDYDTLTLGEVFDAAPARQDKTNAPAMIPSSYCRFDARKYEAQRQHGSYSALAGDIDTGNVPMEQVQAVVSEFVGDHVATLIYSSSGATEQHRKWRVIVPLEKAVSFDQWRDLQEAFFGFMEANGVVMDWALARAGQLVYLPNVPVDKRDFKGEPLFHQRHSTRGRGLTDRDGMAERALADLRAVQARDKSERERAQRAAKQAMQSRGAGGKGAVIDAFNKTYSVEMMLEANGYERGPRDSWRSPHQESKTFATKNFGEYWVSMSASDAGAGLGAECAAGRFGDAFDLYCHFDHKGDFKKAVREAAKVLGLDKHPATATPVDVSGIMAQVASPSTPAPSSETDTGSEKVDWLAPLKQAALPRPSFEFVPAGDLVREPQPVEYLVDELIEHPSLMMLFGAPSAGKSFVAIAMAASVATGHAWLGRDVRQGTVFYLAGEGHAGLSRRLRAWEIDTGVQLDGAPLFVSKLPAQLMDAENAAIVEGEIKALAAKHGSPVLIVIDTLARNMGSGDESSNADIGKFVAHIDGMRHRLGCTVQLVHHSGHLETERARGASALPAAMDASFQMEDKGGVRSLTQKKSKESELAAPIPLTLKEVPIGWRDAKGREINSAAIALADELDVATPKSKALTSRQQEGLQSLCRAVVRPADLAVKDGDWMGVHVESWRVEFYRTCTADDKKKAFQRVRDDLKARGLVRIEFDNCYVRQSEPGLIAHNLTSKMQAAGHGT